jgi:chromosome segregation protein
MLKRLELVGFKSFADKTVFEFPAGLTAIVGPNGSGKSNIVDAVKWVLGEQSAKSLRGGEMADVIFSGSSTRRSLGLAEVTLVFDNSAGGLRNPAAEVQIARRVYRDSEGEYVINGQPSRLKDIKDLFLGTGAGAGAYCIIEQGRVDALLQATTLERRTIFEEAAGISRFKAKKIESLRRLERVDANLVRLRDILTEVENQLRGVRLQAAKAQRHQEYASRLRDLRLKLGLQELRDLNSQLTDVTRSLDARRAELHVAAAQSLEWSADIRRLETEIGDLDTAIRADEATIAQAQVARTSHTATVVHEKSQADDLESELGRCREQFLDMSRRIAQVAAETNAAESEWNAVEEQCQNLTSIVDALARQIDAYDADRVRLRQQIEADQSDQLERLRLAARLQNEAVSAQAHLEQLRRERERLSHKTAQASRHLASLDVELETLTGADAELQDRISAVRQSLAERLSEHDINRRRVEESRRRLSDERARLSGLKSRIDVLEALERSQEGLGTGIRELLAELEANRDTENRWSAFVIGLTGQLLSAPREVAHLLDIALGPLAESVVIRDSGQLVLALAQRESPFSGRIRFLPLRAPIAELNSSALPCPTEIVRADLVVSTDHPELAGLPRQLLGATWLVPNLAIARELAERLPGQRCVTSAGELLEADGTITVGAHQAETGILSRKSELRELKVEATAAQAAAETAERELAVQIEDGERLERAQRTLQQELGVLGEQDADLRERIGQRRERRDGLHEEVTLSRTEIFGLDGEIARFESAYTTARDGAEGAEREAQSLQVRTDQAESELRAIEQDRSRCQQDHSANRVSLAQIEERRSAIHARRDQLANDLHERHSARQGLVTHAESIETRRAACIQAQLRASAELAEICRELELVVDRLDRLRQRRDVVHAELRRLFDQRQIAHGAWQSQQEEVHSFELKANDLSLRRATLIDRLREEHEIDLIAEDEKAGAAALDSESAATAEQEIEELRRKLSRLGSVNLDSLSELAELEQRDSGLRVQFDDLTAAQKSLHEIISTINEDSRRLFAETFALVRANFQDLFRRLFGGGHADVVLDNEADVLESGVEVVARPPGKELRSISLMSGGEKTLTAVALLLAIFRSKPSPFCLLDEVDAALDEANTARLASVLREFLDRSQFIIVTHSKRTMAAADVLYGVTMEESGVSKRVAVRFEDWPSDERQAA